MNDTPDLRPTLKQIIALIGPGWTPKPVSEGDDPESEYNKTHMIAQNGNMEIYISTQNGRYSTKASRESYEISGRFPRYSDNTWAVHTSEYITIKASRKKSPAQVAADIKRRFLPIYTENLKQVVNRVRLETLKANRKHALEEMIAAALESPFYPLYSGSRSDREITISPHHTELPSGKLQVRHDGRISMSLDRLDPETAIEIGKVLQQARKYEQAQKAQANP